MLGENFAASGTGALHKVNGEFSNPKHASKLLLKGRRSQPPNDIPD